MRNLTNTVVAFLILVFSIFLFGGCGEFSNNPKTIEGGVYAEDEYYIDEDAAYYISNIPTKNQRRIIESADPSTFEVIGDGYSKDGNSAYWIDKTIENSDPDTFIVLENGYEKDKDRVYFRDLVLEDADPNTFEIINHEISYRYCANYGRDENTVWKNSSEILGRDPSTFKLIDRECVYSKDKNGVYLIDEKLENIDPEIFEYLGNGYTRYNNTVYHSHDPRETYAMPGPNYKLFTVEGADVSTFEPLTDLYARDKNNIYYGGLVIDEEELTKEHETFAKLIGYSRENLDNITVLQKIYKYDRRVLSKALQIEFEYPGIFDSCIEKEIDISKIRPIADEVPNGYRLSINCGRGSFIIDAVTDDYQVYEAHGVPYYYYPSHDELFKLCSNQAHCKYYKILSDDNEENVIYIMDSHWQWDSGGSYIISTYIPLNNGSRYNTARISMKIGSLPEYSNENYSEIVEQYLDEVVNKELKDEKDIKRIRNFEDILRSI
ncbi:DKNYY domain-containing protein [Patescibacteria group bacterium]